MLTKSFLVVALISLCLYFYGVLITITENEENLCKMTYMYEYPQYVRISFDENIAYPKYNLFVYAEGHLIEDARRKNFNGAPVLFIPGNSGSFKQIRSLASVALRKGLDNGYVQHLDYFAVDLNAEYSGVFGGVLEEQTKFVEICVLQILNLYKHLENRPENIVIIGHSMGGKIAQALLISDQIRNKINLIITLGSPMDSPVIASDHYLHGFYNKIENFWKQSRFVNKLTNKINYCSSADRVRNPVNELRLMENQIGYHEQVLNSKVLITIGGGSRDRVVHAGLTASKYSDIHAMTTSIPSVWVTTDHLCTVWCLQLVLVINRFLYSLLKPQSIRPNTREKIFKGQKWIESKAEILERGYFYFKTNRMINSEKSPIEKFLVDSGSQNFGKWVETNKRIFTERFKQGINETYVQMIRLVDMPQYKMLYGEVVNLETSDYIFGCAANDVTQNMRYCNKGMSITSQFSRKVPSLRHERHLFKINLHNIKKKYPHWTHIILRFLPTKEQFQLNVDIHNSADREIMLNVPKWYITSPEVLVEETIIGSSHYNLIVRGIEETHRTIELTIRPKSCSYNQYHVVAKLCVPWADGYNRYHYFTETKRKSMYIYTPQQRPSSYNATQNPLRVELNLDPSCRYTITVKNSLGMTMARIVQQFSHWLPAHLVAILLLSLKHQISLTPPNANFKCGKLHSALLKSSSFFLITASRVIIKVVLMVKFLPVVDKYDLPLTVSIAIHGASLAIISLGTGLLWVAITFFGNIAHKIIYRIIRLPIPTISGILIPIIERFPLTIGVILIALSLASCGAVALILACIVYFILLSKTYENYLEEFIFKTAKEIAMKLFGKKEKSCGKDEDKNNVTEKGKGDDDKEEKPNTNMNNTELEKVIEMIREHPETAEPENAEENGEIVERDSEEPDDELIKLDQEMEKLLNESLDKEKQKYDLRRKDLEAQRVEFDSIKDGLSKINFHITLFFLLIILTALNLPSVITWAKNYTFSTVLRPDPSIIPSVVTISSLSVLWQMDTPRNLHGYRIIASILYTCATICILYCQDSVYRLNAVIPTVFLFVALHQLCGRKFVQNRLLVSDDTDIQDKIERLRELIK